MGNFTKKPIQLKHTRYTYHENSRISDKLRAYGLFFIACLCLYVGVSNASYNSSMKERIKECDRMHVSRDAVIQCVMIREIKTKEGIMKVSDFRKTKEEVGEMYDSLNKKEGFDIDKLARAVARHETSNCTKGYGKTHNNCFGIKHGNTVPCPGVPKGKMCKFETKEDSYKAFKIIWSKWYKEYPNYNLAKKWTGGDRTQEWLNNVTYFYNQ